MMYKIDLYKCHTHKRVLAVDPHMYIIRIRTTKHQHCFRKGYSPLSHILSETRQVRLIFFPGNERYFSKIPLAVKMFHSRGDKSAVHLYCRIISLDMHPKPSICTFLYYMMFSSLEHMLHTPIMISFNDNLCLNT